MLVELYLLLFSLSFLSFFASLLVREDVRVIFAMISMVLFFFLALSSGLIEKIFCEPTITETNTTVANYTGYSYKYLCRTEKVVDSSLMALNIGLGLLSLVVIFVNIASAPRPRM